MSTARQLQQDWSRLVESLRSPRPMRPGSICLQRPKTAHKDGSVTERGPYLMFSRKEKGKTVSRLLDDGAAGPCRQAVDNFHEFLATVGEIKKIGLKLAELESDPQKKTPRMGRGGKRKGGRADSDPARGSRGQ
jgi:hypothetical protein